jgi:acylphosphatase
MIALRLVVRGRVQGVGFRASTQRIGTQLDLDGWVKNLPDGSVEIHVQGPAERVEQFLIWCHRGPTGAYVEAVEVKTTEHDAGLHGFARR